MSLQGTRPSWNWAWLLLATLFLLAFLDMEEARPNQPRRACRFASIGLAPDPAVTPEAVIQVYAARATQWRGYFGVHTWIAVKPSGALRFSVYEVDGWRQSESGPYTVTSDRAADSRWFGLAPKLIAERRGVGVDDMIARVEAAVEDYPYADTYRIWPGPNSNTFTAHVLRSVPELRVDLPSTAIGKDYLGLASIAKAPSGTGGQLSVLGVLGVLVGIQEGVEVNVLGLTFGVDPLQLGLKFPIAGRVGWPADAAFEPIDCSASD
jgi:hypothetical protein